MVEKFWLKIILIENKRLESNQMKRDAKLNVLLKAFSELYWLKPVDIVWDAVSSYHIQKMINKDDILLDLGCGDGLLTTLMLGGELPVEYDRFINVIPENQTIGDLQFGDIYSNPVKAPYLKKKPNINVDYGLELKPHHIKVAESLNIYNKIIEGRFENIPLPDKIVNKIFSIYAFYWGDDLDLQMKEVRRVLMNNGEFIVILPSEHLYNLHLAKKMADDKNTSKHLKSFFEELDGGRRLLVERYVRSKKEWRDFFEKHSFTVMEEIPVVNEIMFTMQDICQRPFLPMFFYMSKQEKFREYRDSVKMYLCKNVYPKLINNLLRFENDKTVNHAYYIYRVKKSN